MKAEESFYCLYGKQEILFAVGKQYVSANIHSRFYKRGTLAWINRCWGSTMFQFLRFFLIPFFLLEMDFKYRNGLYTVCESFKRIKLSYSFAIESLSLVFIEIELTRIRLSCIFYSRDNLLIFTFQTSFLFTFLN